MSNIVEKERRINGIDDMMSVNCEIMEEIANDGKMTAAERMKGITQGVSNHCKLSGDQQKRLNLMARLGMKADGELNSLSFKPTADE
jgi:hypothetical protein